MINKAGKNMVRIKEDIFDRMVTLTVFSELILIYKKHKEILLYLFFGIMSFLISIGTYALLTEILIVNVLVANIIAWIASVTFAYITNRIWVFEETATGAVNIFAEIGKFAFGRLATLGAEEL